MTKIAILGAAGQIAQLVEPMLFKEDGCRVGGSREEIIKERRSAILMN
nr:hypothetical protein [Lactobacillus taiwanensis]